MTSAAFSVPRNPQQTPQPLVSVTRRAGTASSSTSQAADEAIRKLIDRRRRRNKYGDEPQVQPTLLDKAGWAIGDVVGDQIRRFGLVMWLVRVGAAVAVVAVLASVVLFRGGATAAHSVDGLVVFEGQPLANASLAFHKTGPDAGEPISLTADATGSFRTSPEELLPAGLYAVVVRPASTHGQKPPAVPRTYADPANTPLRVLVSEDLVGLRLLVRR
jgi:hypothetical protein